jgi:hypothetical protein
MNHTILGIAIGLAMAALLFAGIRVTVRLFVAAVIVVLQQIRVE